MGCMRLSTAPDRDDDRSIAVIHAALDTGVTFLDTADVYCHDDRDIGHNERLIARALANWTGDRSRIIVATKGGLTRPEGRWVPDGRAKHLAAACEASRVALGVDSLDLYQLHAPDPRTPFETSIRALAALKHDGRIARVGLSNVNLRQLETARQIVDVDAVQVELSLWHPDEILSGVVPYCVEHGIKLIAHRPLGGASKQKRVHGDPLLRDLARRHGVTPAEIALAWMLDLSERILPIPGPSRVDTARSIAHAYHVALTSDDRAALDARCPAGARLRHASPSLAAATAAPTRDGDVVLIMGLPAAGKSTLAGTFVAEGYQRLNRDDQGGSLAGVAALLERALATGATRVVLDNTYVTRKSRAQVLDVAARAGVPMRGVWLAATLEDAQTNAAWRMVTRYGRLLDPDEIRSAAKRDANTFGPGALFRVQREVEPPDITEGFGSIDHVPFVRVTNLDWTHRAVIVWADDVRRSRDGHRTPQSADDVEIPGGRAETLRRFAADGWRVLSIGWRPEIADGSMTSDQARDVDARTRELLGVDLDSVVCPHAAGPPVCWCRKPLPGLGVVLIARHQLDPAQCLYVGGGSQDPGFARRLGFQYRDAAEFFHAP
jgi:aryl-alcohol dehydrogenase-like predicted oxidoreductase/histidinol phosphatase-like enzyme